MSCEIWMLFYFDAGIWNAGCARLEQEAGASETELLARSTRNDSRLKTAATSPCYSYRRATIGSTREARRAGT